jgi:hypothetical protein
MMTAQRFTVKKEIRKHVTGAMSDTKKIESEITRKIMNTLMKNKRNDTKVWYRNKFNGDLHFNLPDSPTKVIDGVDYLLVVDKHRPIWMRADALEKVRS